MKPQSVIALAVLAVLAGILAYAGRGFLGFGGSGACTLSAEPALVGDGHSAIAMGNRDNDEWSEAVVTISGRGTAPGNKDQVFSGYAMNIETLPSLKRRTIQLDQFQKPDGSRWQPLVMRPEAVEVVARLRGEMCRYESSLK